MMNGPDNPIAWCDYTWSTITGCLHGCKFGPNKTPCYAEVIAERFRGSKAFPKGFDPQFHPNRLSDPEKVKRPSRIFVCSMSDLFGSWVPDEWIEKTLESITKYHWHTFQLLTKAPWNVLNWKFPDNVWLGATITGGLGQEDKRLECVKNFPARVRFLSCEPMEGPVDVSKANPHWVIIGSATGKGAFQPKAEWVQEIEYYCNKNGIPVFHKDNLDLTLTISGTRRMEFPENIVSLV
jgi:protein gp37